MTIIVPTQRLNQFSSFLSEMIMMGGHNLLVKQRFLRVSHVWTLCCWNFKSNWARNGHYSSDATTRLIMTIFEWNHQMMGGHDLNCNREPLRDHGYGYQRKSLLKYSRRCGGKTTLKLFDLTGKNNPKTTCNLTQLSNWKFQIVKHAVEIQWGNSVILIAIVKFEVGCF